tara:strand:+ start:1529 stop:2227 length:699 start_codon:yes stop_codon:yes gene_type:complete
MANYGKGTNGIDGPLSGPLSNPNNGSQIGSYVNHLYYAVDGGVWSWDGSGWILHTSLKGDSGDRGHVGEQGPIGETGVAGLRGLAGSVGNQGFQGTQGLRGIPGAAGVSLSVPMLIVPRNVSIAGSIIDDTYITIDANLARYNIRGIQASYGAESSKVSISYKLIQVSETGIESEVMEYTHLNNTKCAYIALKKSISLNKGDSIYLMATNVLDLQESHAKGYSITLQLRQKS